MRQPAVEQPFAQLAASAELLDERTVEPRLVDAQVLVDEQPVAIEALDVVALVRRSVAPDVDAVLGHRMHELRPGDRAPERRRVEVPAPRRLDVKRPALQSRQSLARERVLAVDEHRVLGAEGERLRGNGADVWLVVLPEVRGERVGDRAVLAHPRERAARVEAAREGDFHPFPDGERPQDDRRLLADAHSRLGSSADSSAGVTPSRHATKTVLSPAIVPATSCRLAMSIASASAAAKPRGVLITSVVPDATDSPIQRRSAAASSSMRSRSDEPGSA